MIFSSFKRSSGRGRSVFVWAWISGAVSNSVLYFLAILSLEEKSRGILAVVLTTSALALTVLVYGRDRVGLLRINSASHIPTGVEALFLRNTFWLVFALVVAIVAATPFLQAQWAVLPLMTGLIVLVLLAQEHLLFRAATRNSHAFSIHVMVFHGLVTLISSYFWFTGQGQVEWWLAIYALSGGPMVATVSWLFLSGKSKESSTDHKNFYNEIIDSGRKVFPGELAQFLAIRSDRFLIAFFLGVEDVGRIIVFLVFFELLSYPLRLLITTTGKYQTNHTVGAVEEKSAPVSQIQRPILWALALVPIGLLGSYALGSLAGYPPSEAKNLFLGIVVAGSFVARIWLFAIGTNLIRLGAAKTQSLAVIAWLAVSTGVMVPMMLAFGLVGAPLSSLIGSSAAILWARTKMKN